jgi:hypothetical protein
MGQGSIFLTPTEMVPWPNSVHQSEKTKKKKYPSTSPSTGPSSRSTCRCRSSLDLCAIIAPGNQIGHSLTRSGTRSPDPGTYSWGRPWSHRTAAPRWCVTTVGDAIGTTAWGRGRARSASGEATVGCHNSWGWDLSGASGEAATARVESRHRDRCSGSGGAAAAGPSPLHAWPPATRVHDVAIGRTARRRQASVRLPPPPGMTSFLFVSWSVLLNLCVLDS